MDLETDWLLCIIVELVRFFLLKITNVLQNTLCLYIYRFFFSAVPGEQSLRYCVYKIDSKVEFIYSSFVPLTPKTTLRWIGFSDYGSLCILDSIGTLQILIKSYWSPLCYVDNAVISNQIFYF